MNGNEANEAEYGRKGCYNDQQEKLWRTGSHAAIRPSPRRRVSQLSWKQDGLRRTRSSGEAKFSKSDRRALNHSNGFVHSERFIEAKWKLRTVWNWFEFIVLYVIGNISRQKSRTYIEGNIFTIHNEIAQADIENSWVYNVVICTFVADLAFKYT